MSKPTLNTSPIIQQGESLFHSRKSQSVSDSSPFNHSPRGFTFTLSTQKISTTAQPSPNISSSSIPIISFHSISGSVLNLTFNSIRSSSSIHSHQQGRRRRKGRKYKIRAEAKEAPDVPETSSPSSPSKHSGRNSELHRLFFSCHQ